MIPHIESTVASSIDGSNLNQVPSRTVQGAFSPIRAHLDLFEPIWTNLDPFGPTWNCFDLVCSGQLRTSALLHSLEHSKISPDRIGYVHIYFISEILSQITTNTTAPGSSNNIL